jgi:hypothetical protein
LNVLVKVWKFILESKEKKTISLLQSYPQLSANIIEKKT